MHRNAVLGHDEFPVRCSNRQHSAGGLANDLLGRGPEQHVSDRPATVGSQDDQRNIVFAGVRDDLGEGPADSNVRGRWRLQLGQVFSLELLHACLGRLQQVVGLRSDGDALRTHGTPILVRFVDDVEAVQLGVEFVDKGGGVAERAEGQVGKIGREQNLLEADRHGRTRPIDAISARFSLKSYAAYEFQSNGHDGMCGPNVYNTDEPGASRSAGTRQTMLAVRHP